MKGGWPKTLLKKTKRKTSCTIHPEKFTFRFNWENFEILARDCQDFIGGKPEEFRICFLCKNFIKNKNDKG